MSRPAHVPRRLAFLPFRGSRAVGEGLLTRRMLTGPTWCRLLPDVYVHRDAFARADHRMWCDAVALLLPPGAAIGGLSAAYLWGVDLLPRDAPVSVVLPPARRMRTHPMLDLGRSVLPAGDLTRFAGLPVTTPVRTAFDLGRRTPRSQAVIALDALLHRRVVKREKLRAYLDEHAGWPGMPLLREVLALAEPLAESPMETRLRLLLVDAGLPRPIAQHEIRAPTGRFVARVDLAYPDSRIAIEYEGDHHRERAQFRRDVTRLNALRAAGWLVLRFTADDVLRKPARVVREVTTARTERRPSLVGTPRTSTGSDDVRGVPVER
ncbi:DUF559 domain-containing protein [Micromonospora polyrhachis]|uniref:DUF559 domain-containing protein n=1 Tax=Micromonospora polyrhachis TaxID=1282883 RepID=A0A7W7WPU6_9ACTN|nr:DUF559 domain-containing protein [Micromonospora polyrhachis]MBB4958608.1 hypothetical protein [Micromonospora polyrhachis]